MGTDDVLQPFSQSSHTAWSMELDLRTHAIIIRLHLQAHWRFGCCLIFGLAWILVSMVIDGGGARSRTART